MPGEKIVYIHLRYPLDTFLEHAAVSSGQISAAYTLAEDQVTGKQCLLRGQ